MDVPTVNLVAVTFFTLSPFSPPAADRRARQLGGCGDERDATSSQGESLGSGPAAPGLLVQQRGQGFILLTNSRNQYGICRNDIIGEIRSFGKVIFDQRLSLSRLPRRFHRPHQKSLRLRRRSHRVWPKAPP